MIARDDGTSIGGGQRFTVADVHEAVKAGREQPQREVYVIAGEVVETSIDDVQVTVVRSPM